MSLSASPSPLQGALKACITQCCRKIRPRPATMIQKPAFSTSTRTRLEADTEQAERPRWRHTPPAMAAPVRTRPLPKQTPFVVNDKEEVLNDAYIRMLGKGGDQMLPEEIKWLAVTHKSFDHGRRGFNDRLAFLGKRIVDLQCSLALLNAPEPNVPGRDKASHPALKGLGNVSPPAKHTTLEKTRVAQLAQGYGLGKAMRWKPRKADNLQSSGVDVVLAHTLYSIIGALALQRGGEVANRVVQERILSPLGLK